MLLRQPEVNVIEKRIVHENISESVKRLGEIPPREVLLGQFAGALNGVLYQVVGALEALREQRSASSAA